MHISIVLFQGKFESVYSRSQILRKGGLMLVLMWDLPNSKRNMFFKNKPRLKNSYDNIFDELFNIFGELIKYFSTIVKSL